MERRRSESRDVILYRSGGGNVKSRLVSSVPADCMGIAWHLLPQTAEAVHCALCSVETNRGGKIIRIQDRT